MNVSANDTRFSGESFLSCASLQMQMMGERLEAMSSAMPAAPPRSPPDMPSTSSIISTCHASEPV